MKKLIIWNMALMFAILVSLKKGKIGSQFHLFVFWTNGFLSLPYNNRLKMKINLC
jgi:hypothetical protein